MLIQMAEKVHILAENTEKIRHIFRKAGIGEKSHHENMLSLLQKIYRPRNILFREFILHLPQHGMLQREHLSGKFRL